MPGPGPPNALLPLSPACGPARAEATRIGHPCQCFARPMTTEGKVIYPDR